MADSWLQRGTSKGYSNLQQKSPLLSFAVRHKVFLKLRIAVARQLPCPLFSSPTKVAGPAVAHMCYTMDPQKQRPEMEQPIERQRLTSVAVASHSCSKSWIVTRLTSL